MNLYQKQKNNSYSTKVKMLSKLIKNILRFSSWIKIATIVCLICLLLAYLCPFIHPGTFWPLPFFGLAYPILFLFSIFFLIVWTLARSKWALIVLAVILIGGKLHFRLVATGENPEITPRIEQTLHVLSYNVRLFDLYNWTMSDLYENKDSIFSYLKTENPDVLCFQEFYHQDKPTKFSTRDAIREFLNIKDYHERYSHKLKGRQNFGIAMLSKYPMISKGDVVFLDEDDNNDNYCIYADIVKELDTFRIYNVHLQSIKFKKDDYAIFGDKITDNNFEKSQIRMMLDKLRIAFPKRANQAQTVMEHAKKSPYPVIICGDFNDTPLSYTYNQFNKTLVDAFRNCSSGIGSTYIGKVPAGRIDYIFHSKELNSMDFKIQDGEYSDHRAISCKIFKPIPEITE